MSNPRAVDDLVSLAGEVRGYAFTDPGLPDQSERDAIMEVADRAEALLEAMQAICALEPHPFAFPADWDEQVKGCSDCQGYAGHPIQQGICNTHRRPLWDRVAHAEREARAIGYRAKSIAREAMERAGGHQ